MNDLFSARLASLLFILVMFTAIVSTAEEQPDVLMDWDEIQRVAVDITDKVKVLPGDILKTESYRIGADEIPALPNPHKKCIAEEGWESFPNGTKTPVRNYSTEQPEPQFNEFDWQVNLHIRRLTGRDFTLMYEYPRKKFNYFLQYRTDFDQLAFSRKSQGKGYRLFDGRYGLAFDRSYGGKYPYSDIGVNAVRNVEYVEYVDGVVKPIRKIPELEGFEPVTRLLEIGEEGQVYYRTWVFLRRNMDGSDLIAVNSDGSLKSHSLEFPEYGIDWGCIDPSNPTYPYIVLYDKNYGNWKGGKRKNEDPMDPYYNLTSIVDPSKKHNCIHIMHIETGEMTVKLMDMFYCRLVSPSLIVVPHIASKGELGFGIYRDGKYESFLPYSCLFADRVTSYWHGFPLCIDTAINTTRVTNIDFTNMTLSNSLFRNELDLTLYGDCSDKCEFLCISKPFVLDGKTVRDLYLSYIGKDGYRSIAFLVQIPEGTIEHAAPDRGFLAFDGKFVYLVNGPLSFKISVPRNIIQ